MNNNYFEKSIEELLKRAYIKYRNKAFELANSNRFSERQITEIVDWVIDRRLSEMFEKIIDKYEKESRQKMSADEKNEFKREIRELLSKIESELRSH